MLYCTTHLYVCTLIYAIYNVMTDFTQSNFNFWSQHPSLKAYFDSGRLDAVR